MMNVMGKVFKNNLSRQTFYKKTTVFSTIFLRNQTQGKTLIFNDEKVFKKNGGFFVKCLA